MKQMINKEKITPPPIPESWEDGLEEFKYDDYNHEDSDRRVCRKQYKRDGSIKVPCNCGADDQWDRLKSFIAKTRQKAIEEYRGRLLREIGEDEDEDKSADYYKLLIRGHNQMRQKFRSLLTSESNQELK